MKISKLFHWLYACLLLLPIACFLPNAFYYGFNAQAQASERIEETPLYAQSNEISTADDIIIGNIYRYTNSYQQSNLFTERRLAYINTDLFLIQYPNYSQYDLNTIAFYYVPNNTLRLLISYYDSENNLTNTQLNITNQQFDFILLSIVNESDFASVMLPYIEKSNYLFQIGTQVDSYTNSITDSMSVAWQQTWSNPLFSWAEDSFLVAPFNYITNLFGVPNNSTFSIALSYWCAISIIWLVFDLFMYVPLLAHRWIDKAKIE